MSEAIASEIWGELKRFVNTVDRAEAAETVIQILMDNDSDVEDIRAAFKGDSDIKRALTAYLDNDKDYAEEEDEFEEEEDEDWENRWRIGFFQFVQIPLVNSSGPGALYNFTVAKPIRATELIPQ
jgi:hypothetical protein